METAHGGVRCNRSMLRGDMVFVSRKEGARAPGFVISPRAAGIITVIGVMAVPNVPVAYLTPVAVFLGALTVFRMESRKSRQARNALQDQDAAWKQPEPKD